MKRENHWIRKEDEKISKIEIEERKKKIILTEIPKNVEKDSKKC